MSTPTPIAIEFARKPAATPRATTTASGDRTFADAVQAQRVAERRNQDDVAAAASAHAAPQAEARRPAEQRQRPDGPSDQRDRAESKGQTQTPPADGGDTKTSAKSGPVAPSETERGANVGAQAVTNANSTPKNGAASQTSTTLSAPAQSARTPASEQSAPHSADTAKLRNQSVPAQELQIRVSDKEPGAATARPVNAATAFAAQTAQRGQESGKSASTATPASVAMTGTETNPTVRDGVSNPTAQALKDALSGKRGARDVSQQDKGADPRTTRQEARSTTPHSLGSMSPALRAAAEAVQQQASGAGSGSANSMPSSASDSAGQRSHQAVRIEAASSQAAAPAPNFDPVLQNTGPQPTGHAGSSSAVGNSAPASAPSSTPAPTTPPAEQVAVQIQRAAAQGQSRVQIRLNPAELGRIDVKLDIGDDGHVRAVLAVDKAETLDLMQRDPRALEKALQAAGLKTDSGSLSFNLRQDQNGQDAHKDNQAEGADITNSLVIADHDISDQPPTNGPTPALGANGRVDIRI